MATTILSSLGTNTSAGTGTSHQSHLIYGANNAQWYVFALTGTQTLSLAYGSSDFSTWNTSGTTLTLFDIHHSEGRRVGFKYLNLSSTDIVHMVAGYYYGQNFAGGGTTTTTHTRFTLGPTAWNVTHAEDVTTNDATLTANLVAYGSTTGYAENGASGYIMDCGPPFYSSTMGGGTGNFEFDVSSNQESGTWIAGWPSSATGVEIFANTAASSGLASLGSGNMLATTDNASSNGKFTNIRWSKYTGTHTAAANILASNVTETSSANWGMVARTTSDIHVVALSNNSNSFVHRRFNGTSWSAGSSLPTLTLHANSGLFMATDGTDVWLYAIDSSNNIKYVKWTASTPSWGPGWITLEAGGASARTWISGYDQVIDNVVGLIWTQANGSNFDVVGTKMVVTTPSVASASGSSSTYSIPAVITGTASDDGSGDGVLYYNAPVVVIDDGYGDGTFFGNAILTPIAVSDSGYSTELFQGITLDPGQSGAYDYCGATVYGESRHTSVASSAGTAIDNIIGDPSILILEAVGTGMIAAAGSAHQQHIFWCVNQSRWIVFAITGTQTLSMIYSPDFVTWTLATGANIAIGGTGTGATLSLRQPHGSIGRNFGFVYDNIANTDVVHMGSDYQNGATKYHYHTRFTIPSPGTTFNVTNAETLITSTNNSTVIMSGTVSILDSNNRPIDCSSYITAPSVGDMSFARGTNTDSGTSWTAGFSTARAYAVTNYISSVAMMGAVAAGDIVAISDNSSTTGNFTQLTDTLYTTSWTSGTSVLAATVPTSAVPAWSAVARTITDIHVVAVSNGTTSPTTFVHRTTANGTTWATAAAPPSLATYSTAGGLFLATDGTSIWLFTIDTAYNIQVVKWNGTSWGAWSATVGGSGIARSYISGYQTVVNGNIALIWMELVSSNYNIVGDLYSTTGPVQGTGSATGAGSAIGSGNALKSTTASVSGSCAASSTGRTINSATASAVGSTTDYGSSTIVPDFLQNWIGTSGATIFGVTPQVGPAWPLSSDATRTYQGPPVSSILQTGNGYTYNAINGVSCVESPQVDASPNSFRIAFTLRCASVTTDAHLASVGFGMAGGTLTPNSRLGYGYGAGFGTDQWFQVITGTVTALGNGGLTAGQLAYARIDLTYGATQTIVFSVASDPGGPWTTLNTVTGQSIPASPQSVGIFYNVGSSIQTAATGYQVGSIRVAPISYANWDPSSASASGLGVATGSGTAIYSAYVGSDSGSGTASASGQSLVLATASALGSTVVSATGSSLAPGTASTSGLAVAIGTGQLIAKASASGSSVATMTGGSIASATVSSSGSGIATGTGQLIATASSSGFATVSGTGSSLASASASASGSAIVSWSGSAFSQETASTTGSATATAVGQLIATASASGFATASTTGASLSPATGSSSGLGTISATGASLSPATAYDSGLGAASATAATVFYATFSDSGSGLATGSITALSTGTASDIGIGSASFVGSALALATASDLGTAIVSGTGVAIQPGATIGTASASGTVDISGVGIRAFSVSVSFAFLANAQSFTGAAGSKSTLSWSSSVGNPLGSLSSVNSGSNTSDDNTWTLSTTFAGLGAPAGATITAITGGSLDSSCTVYTGGSGVKSGAVTLTDGTKVATLSSQRSISGADSSPLWVTTAGVDLTGIGLPTGDSVSIVIPNHLGTSAGGSNGVTLFQDNLNFTLTGVWEIAHVDGLGDGIGSGVTAIVATASDSGSAIVSGVPLAQIPNASDLGSASVSGVSASLALATASGDGTSVESGVGSSLAIGTASATAQGSANAIGTASALAMASATGTGSASTSSSSLSSATASASGQGVASAVGQLIATTTASGSATESGVGASWALVTAGCSGSALVFGSGSAGSLATASDGGLGSASGVGSAIFSAVASDGGISIVYGSGTTPTAGLATASASGAAISGGWPIDHYSSMILKTSGLKYFWPLNEDPIVAVVDWWDGNQGIYHGNVVEDQPSIPGSPYGAATFNLFQVGQASASGSATAIGTAGSADPSFSFDGGTGTANGVSVVQKGYVTTNEIVNENGPVSVECWANLPALPPLTNTSYLLVTFAQGNNSITYDKTLAIRWVNDAHIIWYVHDAAGVEALILGTFPTGGWHHIVGTVDGSQSHLYLDGNKVGDHTCGFSDVTYTVPSILIGGNLADGGLNVSGLPQYLVGSIANVAIYDQTLDIFTIQQHYSAGLGLPVGSASGQATIFGMALLQYVVSDGGAATASGVGIQLAPNQATASAVGHASASGSAGYHTNDGIAYITIVNGFAAGVTTSDITGNPAQQHILYGYNNGLWYLFLPRNTGLQTLSVYYSSDFSTWTPSDTTLTLAGAPNTARNLGFGYLNKASTDVVHMCSTYFVSGSAKVYHSRFTLGPTSFTTTSAEAQTTTITASPPVPSGPVTGFMADGTPVDMSSSLAFSGAAILGIGDVTAAVALNADSGSSWTPGFSTPIRLEAITNYNSSNSVVPVGTSGLLAVGDNAQDASGGFRQLYSDVYSGGTWAPAVPVLAADIPQAATNNWDIVARTTTDVHAVAPSDGSGNFVHRRFDGANWSDSGASIPPLLLATNSGIFLATDGTHVYCSAIGSDNHVYINRWNGVAWESSWTTVNAVGASPRSYLSGNSSIVSGNIALIWAQLVGSNYDVDGALFPVSLITGPSVAPATGSGAAFAVGQAIAKATASGSSSTSGSGSALTTALGAAAGSSVASGSSSELSLATASAIGQTTATGTPSSVNLSEASDFGSATVTAVGQLIAIATDSGSAAASGVGYEKVSATASGSGSASVSGVGLYLGMSQATASGSATISVVGASIAVASAASAGIATVSWIGASIAVTTGSSSGLATIFGTGRSIAETTASATGGPSVASSVGKLIVLATASASGSVSVSAVGSSSSSPTASARGLVSVSAVGQAIVIASATGSAVGSFSGSSLSQESVLSASGSALVDGFGRGLASGFGVAQDVGIATASALGQARVPARASGTASASGAGVVLARPRTAIASGHSTVSGMGNVIVPGVAGASGSAIVSGRGRALAVTTASDLGSAFVIGAGGASLQSIAAASGSGVVSGPSLPLASGVASALGHATSFGVGGALSPSKTASTSGHATVNGSGSVAPFVAIATTSGHGTASGVGHATFGGVASASGSGSTSGTGCAIAQAKVSTSAHATVSGIGLPLGIGSYLASGISSVNGDGASLAQGKAIAFGITRSVLGRGILSHATKIVNRRSFLPGRVGTRVSR